MIQNKNYKVIEVVLLALIEAGTNHIHGLLEQMIPVT